MNTIKFNKLIRTFKNNSSNFEELYQFFFPKIKIFIGYRYRDECFGEDVAQEFFLKLDKIKITEIIKYPTSWVMTVSDNIAKTLLNKLPKTVPINEEALAAKLDYGSWDKEYIPEKSLNILNKLDELTKEIFLKHYWEGYRLKEIALALNMEYDTVKRRHSRGLKKLNKYLKDVPFYSED